MKSAFLVAILLPLCFITPAHPQARVGVLSEPGTSVVAAEFLFSVGPGDEDEYGEGITYLAARTVVAPVAPVLDSLGVHLNILPEKDAISVSLVSAPEAWEEATEILSTAFFRDRPDSLTMIRERTAIVAELQGRSANPADAATRAIDRAFFGADHPWGRPTVGTSESVRQLQFGEVSRFIHENFVRPRTFVAAVGPLESTSAAVHLESLLGSAPSAPLDYLPFEPAERSIRTEYNSITTWVTASFLFPEDADEEAMRFLGFLAAAELSFSPLQRSIYNVESEVVTRVGSGEIRLQIVVPPEESETWEERLTGVMKSLLDSPMLADVYAGHLRRYAGERLMALTAPEDRAHAAVRQLLVEGQVGSHFPGLDGLSQERVREAAASLPLPTVAILGPTLDD